MRGIVVLLVLASAVFAQDSPWEIRMLPADESWIQHWPSGINEAGHVCGTAKPAFDRGIAVLWKDGIWIDVGATYGLPDGFLYSTSEAIDNSGRIGGKALATLAGDPDQRIAAVLWDTVQGTAESLHPDGLGFLNSGVTAMNDSGLVVLSVWNATGRGEVDRAYVLDTVSGTGRLLPVTAELPSGEGTAINEAGVVAGWLDNDQWAAVSHAAVWFPDGTMIDLHEEARAQAPGIAWSRAFGINERGEVSGLGHSADRTESWPWVWSQEDGLVVLDRGPRGSAFAVNLTERMVFGVTYTTGFTLVRATVWIDGVFHELPELPGFSRVFAYGANSAGVILGQASGPGSEYAAMVFEPRDEGDYDGDALKDLWEIQGYQHDNGRQVDLPSMGANPLRRDLFVEIDAMEGHRPDPETLQPVIDAFAAHDIALHINLDDDLLLDPELGTLDEDDRYQWDEFDLLKTAHFEEELESAVRYCVFAHRLATLTDSGLARGEPSSDFIVSLGAFGPPDPWMQAGTFMHELGHVLGLRHGGADVTNRKPNYLSVMNYDFQKAGLRIDGQDGHFDYSTAQLADLDEAALNEGAGLGGAAAGYQTLFRIVTIDPVTFEETVEAVWSGDVQANIDWDGSGVIEAGTVDADLNGDGVFEMLRGHDDWTNLDFNGGTVGFGVGIPPPPPPEETKVEELTVEEAKVIPPPPVEGLAGRAGRRSVRLSWTPVGPYGQGLYRVYRWSTGTERELVAETRSSLISDRPGSGTWTYVVTVTDAVGAESADSVELMLRGR